jgi:hypothetical protein
MPVRGYAAPYRDEAGFRLIEISLNEARQMFNVLDPAPFLEKDLDPEAETYVVGAVEEQPTSVRLKLILHLPPHEIENEWARALPDAIRNYFAYRLWAARRELRHQLHDGRIALLIGVAFLIGCLTIRGFALRLEATAAGSVVAESLLIAGWVAMWRPLQIFLYEWWPIRRRCRTFARLTDLAIELRPSEGEAR